VETESGYQVLEVLVPSSSTIEDASLFLHADPPILELHPPTVCAKNITLDIINQANRNTRGLRYGDRNAVTYAIE